VTVDIEKSWRAISKDWEMHFPGLGVGAKNASTVGVLFDLKILLKQPVRSLALSWKSSGRHRADERSKNVSDDLRLL